MTNFRKLPLIFAGALALVSPASAERRWQGKVPHAAILGDAFAGATVVLGSITGRCAAEFTDLLARDLRAHGLNVVLQSEGGNKPAGPALLISANISRCEALPRPVQLGSGLPAMHIARTEGHFLAALEVLDLAGGARVTTQTLRADPVKQNESQTGNPENPAPSEVLDIALRQAIGETRHLHTAWKDSQELAFMDDKDCNLRQAFEHLKAGDFPEVLESSRANAEACRSNPKALPAALYNLGVANMLLRNYDAALAALAESQKLRDNKAVGEALAQCRKDKEVTSALARLVVAWVKEPPPSGAQVQTGILFSNDLVIRLVQGNVAEEEIVKMIASQPDRFALDPASILALQEAGVSGTVIAAMQAKKR